MKRYALIDVANTTGTARDALGFGIDWLKLFKFLKSEKWLCDEVIYYEGRMEGKKFDKRHKKLESIGYTVRSKLTFFHKNKERSLGFVCEACQTSNSFDRAKFQCVNCDQERLVEFNDHGRHPKANFDVEIAVDALNYAGPDTKLIMFTGDGDFCYLAEELVSKGASVSFVSSMVETLKDRRKRFSTRLRELIASEEQRALQLNEKPRVRFLELNNLRNLIGKDRDATEESAE